MRTFYLLLLTGSGAYPLLALNSEINSVQTSEWSNFELRTLDYYHEEGSLRFTLSFEEVVEYPLVLALSSGKPALFSSKQTRVFANFVDYDGWLNNKSKQFIVFPASTYNTSYPLYISVGRAGGLSTPLNFSISSEYSVESLCPNDCSGHGSCHKNVCKCHSGFIDYDCGTPAIKIDEKHWAKFTIPPNSTRYGYFYLGRREFFRLNFEWEGPTTLISLNWRGYSKSELPSEFSYYSRTLLTSSDYCKEIIYSTGSINSQIMYMALMNLDSSDEEVHIKIRLASDYKYEYQVPLIHVMIGTFSGIFIVLLIGITVKCNYSDSEPLSDRMSQPVGISAETINKICPRLKYRDLDGDAESNCMVCLEEYKPNSKVRRLRCKHVFHSKCIDEWFKSNVYCCLCKRDCSVLDDFNVTAEHVVSSMA